VIPTLPGQRRCPLDSWTNHTVPNESGHCLEQCPARTGLAFWRRHTDGFSFQEFTHLVQVTQENALCACDQKECAGGVWGMVGNASIETALQLQRNVRLTHDPLLNQRETGTQQAILHLPRCASLCSAENLPKDVTWCKCDKGGLELSWGHRAAGLRVQKGETGKPNSRTRRGRTKYHPALPAWPWELAGHS
jgi:hypothetical protein